MPTLQELRDKRANAWSQAKEFKERANGDTPLSTDDEAAWSRALDDVDTLGTQISTRERDERLGRDFDEIDENTRVRGENGDPAGATVDEYRDAFQAWCRFGMQDV